ncbi:MAG: phosphoribosylformylglycinamidine cyclo-ligase [Candidatus Marinimicrobia bacterium]|nr:phosphoribosylformylglycinamidine cyclo-ligase [Candidatus Neomarinimicrobiota bacterium]
MKKINYKSAGVDIDAGNQAVDLIKKSVKSTFNENVLTGIGSFGSLYNLKDIIADYDHPVLVQSIDGVGTKTIIARKMKKYDTIGIDLVSACCNDITVMGAKPLTFLDYIANDKLNPAIIKEIVGGMASACRENNIALVGGETAEMPDTYLSGEHDLVGVVTGIVDKKNIIDGSKIRNGDVVLGLPSTGLQTNGYSLARKLIFEVGQYNVSDRILVLNKSLGESLLEPAYVYNNYIQLLLQNKIQINGMAHISGGGLIENITRVLPNDCAVELKKDSWPVLPIFKLMQEIGDIDEAEMYRTFNMGVGLVIIVPNSAKDKIISILKSKIAVFELGKVVKGKPTVVFT